eukprot:4621940-Pleurochrysis_carterae.AAC.1
MGLGQCVEGFVGCTMTRRKRTAYLRIRLCCDCGLSHSWIPAKAQLMSCGHRPEANKVLKKDANTPDSGQSDPTGPDLRALVCEMALLMHWAVT